MSDIDTENSSLLINDDDYCYDDISLAEIFEIYIQTFCGYSSSTAFVQPVKEPISEALKINSKKQFFLKDYSYINPAGRIRFLDIIIQPDYETFSISYIRFYDDKSTSLSSEEIENGIRKMGNESELFLQTMLDLYINNEINNLYSLGDQEDIYIYSEDCSTKQERLDAIRNAVEFIEKTAASEFDLDNISYFTVYMSAPFVVQYYYNKYIEDEYSSAHIRNAVAFNGMYNFYNYLCEVLYTGNNSGMSSYAAIDGRIYQFTKNNAIGEYAFIYNPKTNEIEGFSFDNKIKDL